MNEVRSEVARTILERKDVWLDIFKFLYILIQKDRIGQFGIKEREGIPGIWGHSYVRTYYKWVGTPPPEKVKMEGGIATSYYVLNALCGFLRRIKYKLSSIIINDISEFLFSRTTTSGIGIKITDFRGAEKVETNLRHSCLGYLILREMSSLSTNNEKLKHAINLVETYLFRPFSKNDLLDGWLKESWPVGGIASYIAARDYLFNEPHSRSRVQRERQIWLDAREKLLDALVHISSSRLYELGVSIDGKKECSIEHAPFWHPIKSLPVLRIHSTLGCLKLVGQDLAKRQIGRARIKNIIKELREQVLDTKDKMPSFLPNSPPSLAAACAMLTLVLGQWYDPTQKDKELVSALLSFIEENWSNPDVYTDYWSEFAAPVLDLEEFHEGLSDKINSVYKESEVYLQNIELKKGVQKRSAFNKLNLKINNVIKHVIPVALGSSGLI